ncbi:MAG: 6-bladed beta-propeller [Fidelibacterota bacterium]
MLSTPNTNITLLKEIRDPEYFREEPGWWDKLKLSLNLVPRRSFVMPQGIDASHELLAIADAGAGGVHLLNFQDNRYVFLSTEMNVVHTPIDVAIAENSVFVAYSSVGYIDEFDFRGEFIKSIIPSDNIQRITGIFYRNSFLYIVDTPGHSVLKMDGKGKTVHLIDTRGEKDGTLNFPTFIYIGDNGNIYVTDTMNFRVQVFDGNGNCLNTVGKRGISTGQLNRPKGISVDDSGNLYIVDSSFDNVQIFSPKGKYLDLIGSSGEAPGQFIMPTDIAVSKDLIYVSDTGNKRIQIFQISND